MYGKPSTVRRPLVLLMLAWVGLGLVSLGCAGVVVSAEEGGGVYRAEPEGQGPPPWAPAHGYRAKYRYRYYPDDYVYYDGSRRLYFYDAGGGWSASVALPSSMHIHLDRYTVIEMDTDRPYVYHSDVVKRYPPGLEDNQGRGKGRDKHPEKR
ncbi:conserved exported hypothetical protein [uncultured Desulfatiglans sp.]|nr:conserved exported hypothetical protein [uncultured Desulfatiglans sp.]